MKHYINYKDFIRIGQAMYHEGGDVLVECWSEKDFERYTKEFGRITARKAYKMCRDYKEQEEEETAMRSW
jgi:hypothetical protein